MSEFTASNGVRVEKFTRSIKVADGDGYEWLEPREVDAVREFFQHEHDEELGRWRYPLDPDWIVREIDRDSFDRRRVEVMNERTFEKTVFNPFIATGESAKHRAARAFFEAHQERKPWHDAQADEVWVVTISGEEIPCTVSYSGPDFEPVRHSVWATIARGSQRIETARRIWPEVAS